MRTQSAIKFPYKTYKNIPCPIVTIGLGGFQMNAYVDSGAFYSIFSPKEAELIGLDYKRGRQGGAMVGDGNIIPVYYHVLPISIGGITFNATLGFSPRLRVDFNLLGRKDIFTHFTIIFDDAKQAITFIPRKTK